MKKLAKKSVPYLCVVLAFACISCFYSGIVSRSVSNFNGFTIVLDAGHGGRDGGSVGVNGTIEKDINLEYTLALKEKLVASGYRVVLTRKNDDGLYSATAKNKKLSDMNERMGIIKKANPNLVISIHMNSFVGSKASGASTYYRDGDNSGRQCAELIQKSLNAYCNTRTITSKVGDFFMVNCSYYTSVLVECGFLSNPEEERKLNTKEYKEQIIDSIFNGVVLYFGSGFLDV